MGLFGQSSPFDVEIEKATSEKNTTEPWGVIMDICDKVGSNPRNAKDCLKAIMKRMGHPDPHVVIQAITLLDACVNNCGKNFHLEVASREFENEFKRLLTKVQPQVATKMRLLLKKWAENDFKLDPQLNLIPSLYHKLKSEGHDFSESNQKTTKSIPTAAALKDPNVVTSQQEEEDIAKAIELSLKDTKSSPKKQQTTSSTYPSLYPSFAGATSLNSSNLSSTTPNQEPRKVRALYDFEAAEDNELTFAAGDIIHVLDDSDPNWWKGYNQQGEGLFPSNFVTADLSAEPERFDINQKNKKTVQFEDEVKNNEKTDANGKFMEDKSYVPEVNEEKIDRLLHLLHEANPEDPSQDSEEMLRLEEQVNKMGPLIDAELERVDRKHAQLTQLSSDLVDAINLYHTLMREPDRSNMPPMMGGLFYPGFNPVSSSHNLYGAPNPGNMYGMQNMYHPPTSLPTMPGGIMHTLPGQAQQQQQPSGGSGAIPQQPMVSLSQIPIPTGNTMPNNFAIPQQTQMIPMQFQNGHVPPTSTFSSNQQPQQQQQQQQPQYQLQSQPQTSQTPQQMQIPSTSQTMTSPQSQQLQQHQSNPQPSTQQPPTSTQIPNYMPPNTSIQGMYVAPQGVNLMQTNMQPGLLPPPTGSYQMPQQPPLTNSGLIGSANHPLPPPPPQSLPSYINNEGHGPSLSLPPHPQPHLAAINQPVTHTILGQSDSKTIIPIHQQQR